MPERPMPPPTSRDDIEKRRCSIEQTEDCRECGAEPTMAISGQMVLVVEDDDSMRQAIARLVGAAGFEVVTHLTAEQALADLDCAGAACVVSDLKLPAMSGLDLLTDLRTRGSPVPLILMLEGLFPITPDAKIRTRIFHYLPSINRKPYPANNNRRIT